MSSKAWRTSVLREVRYHSASWTRIYVVKDGLLKGNLGGYHRGVILLDESLEGRNDPKAIEVLHHEIFHLKIERARLLNAKLGGVRMEEAQAMASRWADDVFPSGPRADLIEHYRKTASSDFGEECLVQMCCAVMFGETAKMSSQLRSVCTHLTSPYSYQLRFLGGYIGTIPYCLHGVQEWPKGKPLPGPELTEAHNLNVNNLSEE